jgi:hypothetical protein
MRKYMVMFLIAALLLTAASAFAFGQGYGMGGGRGYCNLGNIPPEQAQKYADFQKQILPLRQKMVALRTDLAALYAQTATDWNAISQKQKEIVDTRIAIQKAAKEAGFTGAGRCLQQGAGGGMGAGGYCQPAYGTKKMRMGGLSF